MEQNSIKVTRHEIKNGTDEIEIFLSVENCSDKECFVGSVDLWEVSSTSELNIGDGPFEVFRSGRHKNDMPGTFTLGVCDERMKDVLGAMTESGDKTAGQSQVRTIESDHLTILKGSERSLLVEFTGGRKQLFETTIMLNDDFDLKGITSKVLFNIIMEPGEVIETEHLKLVWTDNVAKAIDDFATDKALQYGSRSGAHPSVFCTWYYYGLTVTYEDVHTNLQIMKERKMPFDVFQVDEGWEITLGEWLPNNKFPIPMKEVADEIKEAGFRPGIWTSPFIAHETASIWQKHPDWKLRDRNGNPCLFPMNDTIYQVLDITNPATWDYFRELYKTLTFDWGYTYHKLDFTRASVIYEDADFYDKKITLAAAYYNAVSAIREGMGEDAYFLMCGGLYDPIIGLVDAQRTGSDVLSMWSSNINKDGKTAPYTIKQSVLRYYMNKWWDNDPDALMIRRNANMERNLRLTYGLLNEEEVKAVVVNQFMGGGIMCATEPLDKIDEDRLMEYRRILPVQKCITKPVSLLDGTRFPGMVDVYIDKIDAHLMCVINWDDTEDMPVDICVKELLPDLTVGNDKFIICDYYSGQYQKDVGADDIVSFAAIKPHGANVYKIVKMQDEPVVVKSTGHYSMGAEFDRITCEDGKLSYKVTNNLDCNIEYEILLGNGSTYRFTTKRGVNEGNQIDVENEL